MATHVFYDAVRLRDLRELLEHAVRSHGDRVIVREFDEKRNIIDHTSRQLASDARSLATKLIAEGFEGAHIALIGESSYAYVVTYLAIANWVGVVVPVDRELSADETVKQLRLCDATAVFHASSQTDKMTEVLTQCPGIKMTACLAGSTARPETITLQSLIRAGQALMEQGRADDLDTMLDPDEPCAIIFTSGTTGANKGVMLSHKNITTVIHSALSMFKPEGTYFSILPINHTVEMNLFILGNICAGNTVCFNDGIKHVKENLGIFRPDMSMMVPMLVEHLYKNIWKEAQKAGQAGRLKMGLLISKAARTIGIDLRDRLFGPIVDGLGGRLKLVFCGGAPLDPKLVKGFADFGIHIYNGYGITECSPLVSSNCPLSDVPGSVGMVAPDCRVRIGDPDGDGIGEIQVKGDHVMRGYYKDPASTAATFTEDGWFKTGDLGYLGRKGHVYITGRAKNLIIGSNGKNVFPEEIEEILIGQIPYVKEVVVYSRKDRQGLEQSIVANAYLDPEFTNEVGGAEKALAMLKADVDRVNRHLAKFKRIAHVTIRETEFEKTTTRKIKRNADSLR